MTPPPLSLSQRLGRAAVAILDTTPELVQLTGRSSGNIGPWKRRAAATVPYVAYLVVTGAQVDRVPGRWRVTMQFTASAATEDAAGALLGVVERAFTTQALATLAAPHGPVLADVAARAIRVADFDPDDGAARMDLDLTLVVTPPVVTATPP